VRSATIKALRLPGIEGGQRAAAAVVSATTGIAWVRDGMIQPSFAEIRDLAAAAGGTWPRGCSANTEVNRPVSERDDRHMLLASHARPAY